GAGGGTEPQFKGHGQVVAVRVGHRGVEGDVGVPDGGGWAAVAGGGGGGGQAGGLVGGAVVGDRQVGAAGVELFPTLELGLVGPDQDERLGAASGVDRVLH